jgi:hypothetical protein
MFEKLKALFKKAPPPTPTPTKPYKQDKYKNTTWKHYDCGLSITTARNLVIDWMVEPNAARAEIILTTGTEDDQAQDTHYSKAIGARLPHKPTPAPIHKKSFFTRIKELFVKPKKSGDQMTEREYRANQFDLHWGEMVNKYPIDLITNITIAFIIPD